MRPFLFVLALSVTASSVGAQEADNLATLNCPDGAQSASVGNCPEQALMPGPFIVFFSWGSRSIDQDAALLLDDAAQAFAESGASYSILVEGHSDRSGPVAVNERISRQRAEAVRDGLLSRGVPSEAMQISVAGESRMLIGTADGVREAQNRRVEILFSPSEN